MAKRTFDVLLAVLGLAMLAPVLALVALAIKLDSPGPALFRQERVGRFGRVFRIHKFRTMDADAPSRGLPITVGDDARVTRLGGWLRRYRIDEVPQLIDVLAGHMSLVGPRPEVPRYVAHYPQELRDVVLSVRPGITDPASLAHLNENALLAGASDPEREYIDVILPAKLRHSVAYVRRASFLSDLQIIAQTLRVAFTR